MGCGASSSAGAEPVDNYDGKAAISSRSISVPYHNEWDEHDDGEVSGHEDHEWDEHDEDHDDEEERDQRSVLPPRTAATMSTVKSRSLPAQQRGGFGFGAVSSSRRAKYAVLIGCNYPGTDAALAGCANDVHIVREMLLTYFGFQPADITVMLDTDQRTLQPTGANIKHKLREVVAACKDGDELFVHFSGHGTQVPVLEPDPEEPDHLDEAICPTDMNLLCDNDLVEIFEPLGELRDVKLTFEADCCHSGTLLDMNNCEITGPKKGGPPPPPAVTPAGVFDARLAQGHRSLAFQDVFAQLSHNSGQEVDVNNAGTVMHDMFGDDAPHRVKKASTGEDDAPHVGGMDHDIGVLMSGCQSFETSADVRPSGGKPYGAFTNAVATIVKAHKTGPNKTYPLTYRNLVLGARQMLAQGGFTQSPCLECEARWADTPYIVHLKK